MATICPTVTAEHPHVYREQIERVQPFAQRLHIDLMDGVFTTNKSIDLAQVWWPEHKAVDIHLMFQKPAEQLAELVRLKPDLVIVPVESDCDLPLFAAELNKNGIKAGVALLPETSVESVSSCFAEIQHILIFSGNLGHQGGSRADLNLLDKVEQVASLNPSLEVAWDGGLNDQNISQIAAAGVNVFDVGGFIQSAPDAQQAYKSLTSLVN